MKQNAKVAIIESFKQLVNKKSIDKVTVKEICEHCDVNRQTFYNHFTDIMDVFKFIFYEELSVEIAQNRTFDTWGGGFLATKFDILPDTEYTFYGLLALGSLC